MKCLHVIFILTIYFGFVIIEPFRYFLHFQEKRKPSISMLLHRRIALMIICLFFPFCKRLKSLYNGIVTMLF